MARLSFDHVYCFCDSSNHVHITLNFQDIGLRKCLAALCNHIAGRQLVERKCGNIQSALLTGTVLLLLFHIAAIFPAGRLTAQTINARKHASIPLLFRRTMHFPAQKHSTRFALHDLTKLLERVDFQLPGRA